MKVRSFIHSKCHTTTNNIDNDASPFIFPASARRHRTQFHLLLCYLHFVCMLLTHMKYAGKQYVLCHYRRHCAAGRNQGLTICGRTRGSGQRNPTKPERIVSGFANCMQITSPATLCIQEQLKCFVRAEECSGRKSGQLLKHRPATPIALENRNLMSPCKCKR